jgi:hypothetical protein
MSILISGLTSEMNIRKIQISAQLWFALAVRGKAVSSFLGEYHGTFPILIVVGLH